MNSIQMDFLLPCFRYPALPFLSQAYLGGSALCIARREAVL
jgi:hypothetical protein